MSKSKPRRNRSPSELLAVAGDVAYEIEMLLLAGNRVPTGFSSPAIQEEMNIALESFLLHFRNLRAFLCPSLQVFTDDDVAASDYLGRAIVEDIGDPSILGKDQVRINKLLAHISYSRPQYAVQRNKSWFVDRMMEAMATEIVKFFKMLTEEQRLWFFANQIVRRQFE